MYEKRVGSNALLAERKANKQCRNVPVKRDVRYGATCGQVPGGLWQVVSEKLVRPPAHDEEGDEHAACLLNGGPLIGSHSVASHLREEGEPSGHDSTTARRVKDHVLVLAGTG